MTFAQPFTDYEILDRVGAGAMGTVFKARHRKLSRLVALKVLRPSLARDRRYVERLRREARLVASLNHPHIVTGFDLGEEGGYHFFVMEFVEGKSLRTALAERGLFPEDFVRKVAQQVAQALAHAHACGIIHRDIKPANLLLDATGNLKLTDLGLAKGPTDMTLTRDGATVGTPQYISPEQARNPQDVDVRSDLYSLGATLYHLATGVPPFRAETLAELILQVLHDPPVPPERLNPELSAGMSLVLRKLLVKDRQARYQTPAELLADLDRLEQQLPPAVDPALLEVAPQVQRTPPDSWARRAAMAAIAVAALGLSWWLGTQSGHHANAAAVAADPDQMLDLRLLGLNTPGARWLALRAAPLAERAAVADLARRERELVQEVRDAVANSIQRLLTDDWAALVARLRDPASWPDRRRLERELVWPRLQQDTGLLPEQLQELAPLPRLEALAAAIDRDIAERDAGLLLALDDYLTTVLAAQLDERLLAMDFRGAEQLWAEALPGFVATRQGPPRELWPEAVLQRAQERRDRERQRWRGQLDAAEARIAEQMLEEAEQWLLHCQERRRGGADPALLLAELERFPRDLARVYPSPAAFRGQRGLNPWPRIERRCRDQAAEIEQAMAVAQAAARERWLDEVWRLMLHGAPQAALELMGDGTAEALPEDGLAEHRRCLRAAVLFQDAVLAALARSPQPLLAMPREGTNALVELRAERHGNGWRLLQLRPGAEPLPTTLANFRLGEFVIGLRSLDQEPLGQLAAEVAGLGGLLWAMVCDDRNAVGVQLQQAVDAFVVRDIGPRLLRLRGQQGEPAGAREPVLATLRRRLQQARAGGSRRDLTLALMHAEAQLGGAPASDAGQELLREAKAFLQQASRREELAAELLAASTPGTTVEVAESADALAATAVAAVLLRGAGEGWYWREDWLEWDGRELGWAELVPKALRWQAGVPSSLSKTTLVAELSMPSALARRVHALEFRGLGVVLAVAGNEQLGAAWVDGEIRREDAVQKAYGRALANALQPGAPSVLGGAVHRLELEVDAPLGQRRARVRLRWEDQVLLDEVRAFEPLRAVEVLWIARQQVGVRLLQVQASSR